MSSSIPPSGIASIAQTQVSQTQRAAENDAPRDAAARRATRQRRKDAASAEFVEDMAAATRLRVDPDARQDGSDRRKRRPRKPRPEGQDAVDVRADSAAGDGPAASGPAPEPPADSRARSAALLSEPGGREGPPPPPFVLDIEA